ncbi:MAG TPA: type II secretion system protein [Acetivibrio clariflavus]|nr:type II secretion system protein [Acetivibrio clariflavus]HPU41512.1 type II secretion system protein [Acetivibrio clariflavus]
MEKFIKNNKGFSLVELLIVMAIIGIIAVVSITLFTNVISNSRKKSDEQQALQIEKAVISYMMQSNDYRLEYLKYDGAVHSMDGLPSEELIYALQNTIICTLGGREKEIYPILNPKFSSVPSTLDYAPFWSTSKGGKYIGYKIEVYPENANCNVTPVTTNALVYVY